MTSPRSFTSLKGKMQQHKATNEAASMSLMKSRYEQEMAAERAKHAREMESLSRQKDAQASALAYSPTRSPTRSPLGSVAASPNAMVPISAYGAGASGYGASEPPRSARKSPTSGYKMVTRPASAAKSSYGASSADPNPTGFMSPVTYNRKFNQLVSDMEVQTQLAVDEALRDQRDRHADALERVVGEKEAEMALRLSELARELEQKHASEVSAKLSSAAREAEETRLRLLAEESSKIDELLGEAEMFKIQSEAQLTDTSDKFKRLLSSQLEEQRISHNEELRRSLLEAEARATELRVSVVGEKDKQFASEKDALEARLRAAAAQDLDMAQKRFEANLRDELTAQVGSQAHIRIKIITVNRSPSPPPFLFLFFPSFVVFLKLWRQSGGGSSRVEQGEGMGGAGCAWESARAASPRPLAPLHSHHTATFVRSDVDA